MAQGDIPVDNAAALKNARDTAALAGMLADGFIPNSIVKGSLALPEIWMNFSDFQQKANDLQIAATALADATQANGFEASKAMVQAVGPVVRRLPSAVSQARREQQVAAPVTARCLCAGTPRGPPSGP